MDEDVSSEQAQLKSNPRVAFSEKVDALRASIDLLYIPNNSSGRNKFREKWPEIALHIFGPELIKYDNQGTDNITHRKELELQAEERWVELKLALNEFEENSVDSGFLQLEYIGKTIDRVGITISPYFYAPNIIERVRPGLLKQNLEAKSAAESDQKLSVEEKNILSNQPAQTLDHIRPISTNDVGKKSSPSKGILIKSFNSVAVLKKAS